MELVRGLADENVINEVTDELKEKAKAVSFVLLKPDVVADSDGGDDALRADVDWTIDEEDD